jgi:hypothetical protein
MKTIFSRNEREQGRKRRRRQVKNTEKAGGAEFDAGTLN